MKTVISAAMALLMAATGAARAVKPSEAERLANARRGSAQDVRTDDPPGRLRARRAA